MWSATDPDIRDDTPAAPSINWYLALAALVAVLVELWWFGRLAP